MLSANSLEVHAFGRRVGTLALTDGCAASAASAVQINVGRGGDRVCCGQRGAQLSEACGALGFQTLF